MAEDPRWTHVEASNTKPTTPGMSAEISWVAPLAAWGVGSGFAVKMPDSFGPTGHDWRGGASGFES
jgi:hypothetical protein